MPTKIVASPTSTEVGLAATFRLAADAALEDVSGKYFKGTRETDADAQAHDRDARRRLAEISRGLVEGGA